MQDVGRRVGVGYFTEMRSGSEAGSYFKLIDFVSLNSRLESNKERESFGFVLGRRVGVG